MVKRHFQLNSVTSGWVHDMIDFMQVLEYSRSFGALCGKDAAI